MSIENYYPDLVKLPYHKVSVEMGSIVNYIKSFSVIAEIKRAAHVIIRNESGNGAKFVNNNGIGLQSDCGVWPDKYDQYFNGFCVQNENMTGHERGFLCFKKWQNSLDILIDEVQTKGLFIGGHTHSEYSNEQVTDAMAMCRCYEDLWVYGEKDYKPTKIEISDFTSMYEQAKKIYL